MKLDGYKAVEQEETNDTLGNGVTTTENIEESQKYAASKQKRALKVDNLMELICSPENMNKAYKRVVANKGAAGIDNMQVGELKPWLKENKAALTQALMEGKYTPDPVRKVEIPKPTGGKRMLGIPTVRDRLVQQAILQVLTPLLDPHFSESSYGFRPNRSAHQALKKAQEYVQQGKEIVVDIDLEKFFDRVNHDVLMSRLSRYVADKRLLRTIGNCLRAGIMDNGVCVERYEGTPQGGPLSPLLANLLLDDLDRELEKRGHSFCRYADDCNIYVNTQRAGERVMESVTEFLEKKLKLKVNKEKSTVSPSSQTYVPGLPDLRDWDIDYSIEELIKAERENKEDNAEK